MELGLTLPLQAGGGDDFFCWDLHRIVLRGRESLLAVHCATRCTGLAWDMTAADWADLSGAARRAIGQALLLAGIRRADVQRYFSAAGPAFFTGTHGRREVAFLNRAWNDVMALDYAVDTVQSDQPLLVQAVNELPCRCAGANEKAPAAEHLRRAFVRRQRSAGTAPVK